MTEFWQNIAIVVFIVIAVAYLVFNYIRSRKSKNACKDCALFQYADKKNKTKNNNSSSSNKKE